MSTTLWVLSKTRNADGDDYDHSALFNATDRIDALCNELGVRPLSDFLDWTDFNANMQDDEDFPDEEEIREKASWFKPEEALPTFKALQAHLAHHPAAGKGLFEKGEEHMADYLPEELADCIAKIENIQSEGDAFHLCVVM